MMADGLEGSRTSPRLTCGDVKLRRRALQKGDTRQLQLRKGPWASMGPGGGGDADEGGGEGEGGGGGALLQLLSTGHGLSRHDARLPMP